MHDASISTVFVEPIRIDADQQVLKRSIATGFLWRVDNQDYLITNWHNVTGIHAQKREMISDWYPNSIIVHFKKIHEKTEQGVILSSFEVHFSLYDKDAPVWYEHPNNKIDCVAIPINLSKFDSGLANKRLNEIDFDDSLEPYAGMDCFILGYPEGLKLAAKTPIWKKGSIASEPSQNIDNLPLVYVDTATRKGMSGSPVIVWHNGIHAPSGRFDDSSTIGRVENVLGIYSSRDTDDTSGIQIGFVWKKQVIEEIISAKKRGKPPELSV